MTSLLPPREVLQHYFPKPDAVQLSTLGQGNINDTFLAGTTDKSIVLQRINDQVFPVPQLLIDNLQQLSRHLLSNPEEIGQYWEDVVLVPTRDGSLSVCDGNNKLWRALSYISNSHSVPRVTSSFQAEQMGWALGHFHNRLNGLEKNRLLPPLPRFHHIPSYLNQYDRQQASKTGHTSAEILFCMDTIRKERSQVLSLEKALNKGEIHETVIHGDPKIANVLFDKDSDRAVSIIDLDTVGPGLLQHDIGDCLRSVSNKAGEESDPTEACFDLDICSATLKGYFSEAHALLTAIDREFIYDGLKTITFELGLRFFTDYLQGGTYFKCKSPEETLHKSLVQFSLLQDIIAKEHTIRRLTLEG
ncbi:MAG: aminoglycoside phosphotransferase family protein [Desulfocapsa sp.]|nr:aminoglycoside phosphotransferase family protein [Desulfocapsa sp.]